MQISLNEGNNRTKEKFYVNSCTSTFIKEIIKLLLSKLVNECIENLDQQRLPILTSNPKYELSFVCAERTTYRNG